MYANPSHPDLGDALPGPVPILVRSLILGPILAVVFAVLACFEPAHAAPLDSGSGSLLLEMPDAAPVEAPRLKADVAIEVSGPTARARVTQAFRNTTDQWVEGRYLYPLPEDAAVDTMKLVVGDRVIVADIREREQAKRDYEAAKREGKAAALTEQHRPNLFTNAVANIGPGETVLVQIEYQQPVRQSGATYSLRLPTVAAPRYSPPAPTIAEYVSSEEPAAVAADPVPDRKAIAAPVLDPATHAPVNPLTLSIRLQAGFPIGSLTSATHAIRVEEPSAQERVITLQDGATAADRDFELAWTPQAGAGPSVGLFREHVAGQDTVLAVVTPPENTATARNPRDIVFVIDNSGSMGGASIRQAKASLLAALGRLQRQDRFNVIRFDHTMQALFADAVPADEDHLDQAKSFVAGLEAQGGTEMLAPLQAALRDATPEERSRIRQVVFLTDGAIGNESQIFSAITSGRGRTRLFMVGIGSAPNSYLMRHAAELGRGTFTQIGSGDQVVDRMRDLFTKLESPVVTDLTATFSDGQADVTPELMPDLYRGEPLIVSARMAKAHGTLTLSGRIGEKPWRTVLSLDEAREGAGVAKLWAREKIAGAETARLTGRLSAETADAAILRLALDHKLMTRLTSLVAVDTTPRRPAGHHLASTDLPLNLPAGWEFEKVFGQPGEVRPYNQPPRQRRAETAPIRTAAADIALPQTATDFEQSLWIGLMLLGLGTALALRSRILA